MGVVSSLFMWADIHLPAVFTDNMVLQRNSEVTIWGNANPNEEITLTADFLDKEYKIKAGNTATFKISFPTPKEGGPYNITLKGYNEVKLKNVMLGEVWLLSGQSNMEMTPSWGILNKDEEVAKAIESNIRFFTVQKAANLYPQTDVIGKWEVCTPETMKNFSAVGYYFAQKLQQDLKGVPIGLINSSWGGSAAELWTPDRIFKNQPNLLENYLKLGGNEYYPTMPGGAYNAMISPFNDYKIAGNIWYQGETNTGNYQTYNELLSSMIQSWRKDRGYEFPFYIVQIAPCTNYAFSGAEIRNAQRLVAKNTPQSGLVVIGDTITPQDDIHPKNKKPVGQRLSNLIFKEVYEGNSGLVESPEVASIEYNKGQAVLYFNFGEGLYFKNKTTNQFEIAGNDGKFYPAKASLKNQNIILQSPKVKNPSLVRYNWDNKKTPDVFNSAGLPMSTFTTEER